MRRNYYTVWQRNVAIRNAPCRISDRYVAISNFKTSLIPSILILIFSVLFLHYLSNKATHRFNFSSFYLTWDVTKKFFNKLRIILWKITSLELHTEWFKWFCLSVTGHFFGLLKNQSKRSEQMFFIDQTFSLLHCLEFFIK